MYEILCEYLKDTPYADRLVSAEPVINALRGRKTPAELERVRRAVEITDEIYKKTFDFIKVGMTEIEIGGRLCRRAQWCLRCRVGCPQPRRATAGEQAASGKVTLRGATITFQPDAGMMTAYTFLPVAGTPVTAFSLDRALFTRLEP